MKWIQYQDLAWLVHRLRSDSTLDLEIWRDDDGDRVLDHTSDVSEIQQGTLSVR